jgi:hypothetical protein
MTTYEIRVGGEIPADILERIGDIEAVRAAGTTIEVNLTDEAALWGLIEVLRNAGIEMLEVRRHSQEAPGDP